MGACPRPEVSGRLCCSHAIACKLTTPRLRIAARSSATCRSQVKPAVPPANQRFCGAARLLHLAQQAGLAVAATSLSTALALGVVQPPAASAVTTEQLLFLEAWRAVDRAYVDKTFNGNAWFRVREQFLKQEPMNTREETYAAMRKVVSLLDDPFTRFLEPARYAALKRSTAGALTGVGLEVGYSDATASSTELVVVTPSAGGPAERAGIQPRDTLVAIDDQQMKGMSLYEAGEKLQGPEGTQVTLTVKPHDSGTTRTVTLTRERITLNPVSWQLCPASGPRVAPVADGSSLGYVRVTTFNKKTPEAVRNAIKALKEAGAQRYVLDIRNNGGGFFPAGVDVARMWLNSGDIVLIADSSGVRDSYSAMDTALEPRAPLAVLVNRGTASASEVLAGALQDNKRATIVGTRTFGKGLIQTTIELSDGSGVAVTVARYQTPLGDDINKVGITPDLALGPDALPAPGTPEQFCGFVAKASAPQLFEDLSQPSQSPTGSAVST